MPCKSDTKWVVLYEENVVKKDIIRLDSATKQRIRAAIERKISVDPLLFGKPLRFSLKNLRSLRIGDYRIIYHVNHQNNVISVVKIGHRREVYD